MIEFMNNHPFVTGFVLIVYGLLLVAGISNRGKDTHHHYYYNLPPAEETKEEEKI